MDEERAPESSPCGCKIQIASQKIRNCLKTLINVTSLC